MGRCAGTMLLAGLLVAFAPGATAAQVAGGPPQASPELDRRHWALEAIRRAETFGLLDDHLPAQQNVPRDVVGRALHRAADRAGETGHRHATLFAAWAARFDDEFPGLGNRAEGRPRGVGVHGLGHRLEAAARASAGGADPGRALFPDARTGAMPVPDTTAVLLRAALALAVTPYLAVYAEPSGSTDRLAVEEWDVVFGWRGVGAAAGRRPVAYGSGRAGGIVMSGQEPITRLQVHSRQAFRLPGPLARIGAISMHGFGGWLSEPRHPGDPYVWGISGSLRPHSRVTVAVHRASIIGGDSVPTPLTGRNFLRTFVGHNLLGFENEVVSVEGRLRLPTERTLPLTVYGEWGAEDAAGAWRDVPGRMVGLYAPALPGVPGLGGGVEYASFAGSCCGNPPWYRHAPHAGGWVVDREAMGHPLGGEGREGSAYASLDLPDVGARLTARAFSRRRTGENLFVPGREGSSAGGTVGAAFRPTARLEAVLDAAVERGDGWTDRAVSLGIRTFF
jgi:hypothetical protein